MTDLSIRAANWDKAMTPYEEGVLAAAGGMSESANPYAEGTDAHAEWAEGYRDAPDDSELDLAE